MKDDVKTVVSGVLTEYLEANHSRKTPERYAILDAVYSLGGFFTIDDVVDKLGERNFQVSRGTLYNALRLFVELRLVIRHKFQNATKYEACYVSQNHSHLICTMCGKTTDVDIPGVSALLSDIKVRRFKKERYSLYVYGVCASCQYKSQHAKAQKTGNK